MNGPERKKKSIVPKRRLAAAAATPQPPGAAATPQPPGATATPQPPAAAATSHPPGAAATPIRKQAGTPKPAAATSQPPGAAATATPKPAGTPKPAAAPAPPPLPADSDATLRPKKGVPATFLTSADRARLLSLLRSPYPASPCRPTQSSSSCWLNSALVCLLLPWSNTIYRLFSRAFLDFNRMNFVERERFDAMLLYACMLRHGGGGTFSDSFLLHKLGLERGVGQDDVSRGLEELMKVFPGQHLFEDRGDVRLRIGLEEAERALEIGVEVGDDVHISRGNMTVGLCVDQDALRTLMEERQADSSSSSSSSSSSAAASLSSSVGCNSIFSLEFDRRGNVVHDEHHDLEAVVSEHFKYRGEMTWWSHALSAYASPRAGICEKLFFLAGPVTRMHKVSVNLGDSCKSAGLVPLFFSHAMQELTLPCIFSSRTWDDQDFPDFGRRRDFVLRFPVGRGEIHPVRFEWGSEFHTSGCTLRVCEMLAADAQSAALMCANWIMLLSQIAVHGAVCRDEAEQLLGVVLESGAAAEVAAILNAREMDASGLAAVGSVDRVRQKRAAVEARPPPEAWDSLRKDYYSRYMFRTMIVQLEEPREAGKDGGAFPYRELGFRLACDASNLHACTDSISEVFAAARVCEFPLAFPAAGGRGAERMSPLISKMRAFVASEAGLRLRAAVREGAARLLDLWTGPRAEAIYGVCRQRYVPVGVMLRVVRDHLQDPVVVAAHQRPPPGFEASFLYVRKKTVHRTPGMEELSEGEIFVIENPRRMSQHRFILEIGSEEGGVVTFEKGVFSETQPVRMEVVSGCIPTQRVGGAAAHWYSIAKTDAGWMMLDSIRGKHAMDQREALEKIERDAILLILRRVSTSMPPAGRGGSGEPVDPPKIVAEAIVRLRKDEPFGGAK